MLLLSIFDKDKSEFGPCFQSPDEVSAIRDVTMAIKRQKDYYELFAPSLSLRVVGDFDPNFGVSRREPYILAELQVLLESLHD